YHTRPFFVHTGAEAQVRERESQMASYTTGEIRGGLKVLLEGEPYTVIENEFVKPGKGQAFNRIKVRNLKTGRTIERTFKSGESLEAADVVDTDMQYLYQDGDFWHFMVPENFEQYTAGKSALGENAQWLKEGVVCIVTLWNNVPLVVTPPPHIELKVIETDPGLRGDTATGGQKPAKLETGAVVRVPLFINEGEVIRIDTRTGEYISRSKGAARPVSEQQERNRRHQPAADEERIDGGAGGAQRAGARDLTPPEIGHRERQQQQRLARKSRERLDADHLAQQSVEREGEREETGDP